MDFRLMLTRVKNISRRAKVGVTLVEMMVAMAIGGIVLAIVGSLSLWSSKSFAAMANYAELDNASRNALDRVTREIRQVQGLNTYTDNANLKELSLVDSDGQPLYFRYNKAAKTLTRVKKWRIDDIASGLHIAQFQPLPAQQRL